MTFQGKCRRSRWGATWWGFGTVWRRGDFGFGISTQLWCFGLGRDRYFRFGPFFLWHNLPAK